MRIRNLSGVLALAAVGACSLVESNVGPRVTVSAVTAPVDLNLGDTVHVNVTVRNTGDREVEVGAPGCNTGFLISDLQGNAYEPMEQVACTLELRAPLKLASGATHSFHVFTTGRAIPQGSQAQPGFVPRGTYRVRPFVHVTYGNEDFVLVTADPVLVTFR